MSGAERSRDRGSGPGVSRARPGVRAASVGPVPHEPARPPPRVAVLTGAGRVLGRAVARALAASGHALSVVYLHDQAGAESLVEELLATGATAVAVRADVH